MLVTSYSAQDAPAAVIRAVAGSRPSGDCAEADDPGAADDPGGEDGADDDAPHGPVPPADAGASPDPEPQPVSSAAPTARAAAAATGRSTGSERGDLSN
ncbi:hypothetical protein ACFYUY_07545 [Kitasatospora sp. NPDC004745]|uniref:hypothetical protein n=1 Tax=Kitasatospora sp. NPDC004745 TaxID=3364019 RepID=UPI0036CC89DB